MTAAHRGIPGARSGLLFPFLLLAACGGGGGGGSNTVLPDGTQAAEQEQASGSTTELEPFVAGTPWSEVLVPCVMVENASQSCSLDTLPLVGQSTASPTVTHIMQRAVIDHAWMGERLQAVLPLLPPEILLLMRSVTAIVIASDIRPSFYSSGTGAIYLDPYYLWMSNEEKSTISRAEDFRSGFSDSLAFVSLSRYVENGELAWQYYDLAGDETRGLNDLLKPLAALLFHELAHANDFFPQSQFDFLEGSQSVAEAAESLADERVAIALDAAIPLTSELWQDLAQVMYRGANPTAEQRELSAEYVGEIFETDGASDDYGYSTIYEDVAMLFEEVMMNHHYGIDRDIAYTPRPADPDADCSSYQVAWGVRNRVATPLVKSRAEFVLQEMLDENDTESYFDGLGAVIPLESGAGWCDTVAFAPVVSERDLSLSMSTHSFSRFRLK